MKHLQYVFCVRGFHTLFNETGLQREESENESQQN